jgi:hypothetical protein
MKRSDRWAGVYLLHGLGTSVMVIGAARWICQGSPALAGHGVPLTIVALVALGVGLSLPHLLAVALVRRALSQITNQVLWAPWLGLACLASVGTGVLGFLLAQLAQVPMEARIRALAAGAAVCLGLIVGLPSLVSRSSYSLGSSISTGLHRLQLWSTFAVLAVPVVFLPFVLVLDMTWSCHSEDGSLASLLYVAVSPAPMLLVLAISSALRYRLGRKSAGGAAA